MTTRTRWMVAAGLLALAGCSTGTTSHSGMAGTSRMTSRQMCTEAGGTYSSAGCQPATSETGATLPAFETSTDIPSR